MVRLPAPMLLPLIAPDPVMANVPALTTLFPFQSPEPVRLNVPFPAFVKVVLPVLEMVPE